MILLKVVSTISPLFILIGCWRHRFTLLWFYAAAGFITEILSLVIKEKQLAGNAFLLVEFLILSLYYRKKIYNSNLLFIIITLCVSGWFVLNTFIKSIYVMNLADASAFCLVYILYSILFFYSYLKKDPSANTQHNMADIGITIAIFVFASGSFMLFLFSPLQLKNETEEFYILWGTVFTSLNIFRYTLIAIALYKKTIYNAE